MKKMFTSFYFSYKFKIQVSWKYEEGYDYFSEQDMFHIIALLYSSEYQINIIIPYL